MTTTTAAATTAGVTIPTIRTWCRTGAITATKAAGRWVIDTASLARRIAIGAARARKQNRMDLTATYTHTYAGFDGPVTITPEIKAKNRYGVTVVTNLAPLLADQINAINEYDRLHVLEVLWGKGIYLRDEADETRAEGHDQIGYWRDYGRVGTDYRGTKGLPVEAVLDLAEALRTELGL
jgi:hypothetical protein